jgi:hypothetical protein
MNIKRGVLVNHTGGNSWGAGKVMEVSLLKATIQFSDGITRMIASSHYNILQPAEPGSFIPTPESIAPVKVRATVKRVKKVKNPILVEQLA